MDKASSSVQTLWLLRRLELFRGDTDEELQPLTASAAILTVRRRTPLFLPGDTNADVWFLSGGRVQCCRVNHEGHAVTTSSYDPGSLIGAEALLVDGPREEQAEVVSATAILLKLPHALVLDAIGGSAARATRLARMLTRERRELSWRLERVLHENVTTRVAGELYALACRYGTETPEGVGIRNLPQGELAARLGTTRESVGVAIRTLREQGLLRGSGRRLLVPSMAKLRVVGARLPQTASGEFAPKP